MNIYSVPTDGTVPSRIAVLGDVREQGGFSPTALAVSPDGRFIAVTIPSTPAAKFVQLEYDISRVPR